MAFRKTLLSLSILNLFSITYLTTTAHAEDRAVVLPTIVIEAMDEGDPIKTYVDYKQANVTRNGLDKKDIPQTIDTIDVSKYKTYGANDLSVMLQGTPGIDTSYDMRGDGIMIRGFSADTGDIYRDGIRESGQIRRSTANVERIEILKGPASVLYGRSGGGGVINMVTKYANFDSKSSIGGYVGSYDDVGYTFDLNQLMNDNFAVRLTGEYADTNSFREGIGSQIEMLSPSFTYRNDDQTFTWTTQYTYDKLTRVPDRGPSYEDLPKGTSIEMGFAQDGDYVEDTLQLFRTNIKYDINDQWKLDWSASYRETEQNFDHFYAGDLCTANQAPTATNVGCYQGYINQRYYWQQTDNITTSTALTLQGDFDTGAFSHHLTTGVDYSIEEREPLLSNKDSSGALIYGFVNPLTGDRFNNRPEDIQLTQHNYYESKNLGIFIQDLITIVPTVKVMLGVRFDDYDSSAENKLQSSSTYGSVREVSDQSWSPNAGIIWQPVPEHSLYASYSRSFAPFGGRVGVNTVSATTNLDTFNAEPELNDQFEVGVKSEWLDGRLSTQFSAFDIKKHNIRYNPDENDPYTWAVAGEHRSQGVELSFIGSLLDDLYVRGGYGYKEAQIKENKADPALEGNELENTSKHTANLFVRYLATDKIYAEIGATYMGSYYVDDENTFKMPDWTRVDAAIGYKDDNWSITGAVNNVTDKEYWRSSSMLGTPRNYLLRVNYLF